MPFGDWKCREGHYVVFFVRSKCGSKVVTEKKRQYKKKLSQENCTGIPNIPFVLNTENDGRSMKRVGTVCIENTRIMISKTTNLLNIGLKSTHRCTHTHTQFKVQMVRISGGSRRVLCVCVLRECGLTLEKISLLQKLRFSRNCRRVDGLRKCLAKEFLRSDAGFVHNQVPFVLYVNDFAAVFFFI